MCFFSPDQYHPLTLTNPLISLSLGQTFRLNDLITAKLAAAATVVFKVPMLLSTFKVPVLITLQFIFESNMGVPF